MNGVHNMSETLYFSQVERFDDDSCTADWVIRKERNVLLHEHQRTAGGD